MVQWWYGHNAVAFFLTTPFLGLMYYYVPKAVNRPVYSYRLSIIHFWALVFIYIWAGPHHLLYSVLPDWAQTLGVIFSVMLLAPSWGGMVNGLLTMRGAWDRIKTDPVLKFFVAALTFYGMATFEGPLLSFKSVNALAHFTDWIIGHVHSGTLGWNGFMIFAILYYLVPKVWNTKLYSTKLATLHFWIATVGVIMYILSMWVSGITQGLMWGAMDGARLMYPDFIETVVRIVPLYTLRAVGGTIYLVGYVLLIYNLFKTIAQAPKEQKAVVYRAPKIQSFESTTPEGFHRYVESAADLFVVFSIFAVVVGSVIEIMPSLVSHQYMTPLSGQKPYTPLELAGRDIYVREGCYTCHSQMVRPLQAEVLRYGERSHPEESMYDHPFQWGSKRTGPDLARVGGKYPDLWHYRHMLDPRAVTPKSIMPSYSWLVTNKLDTDILTRKLVVMKQLGVPYSEQNISHAITDAQAQAKTIADGLQTQGVRVAPEKEIIALIAYLQTLHFPKANP